MHIKKYKSIIISITLIGIFYNCSSTKIIPKGNPYKINRNTYIIKKDSTLINATSVLIQNDTILYTIDKKNKFTKISILDISKIYTTHMGKGFLEGISIGLLTGTLAGGLVAFVGPHCEYDEFSCKSNSFAQLEAGIALTLISTTLGTVIGISRGHQTQYVTE